MKNEIIITGYSNVSKEGVALHTNKPASLKTGNVRGDKTWVSWDKIGAALYDDYVIESDVESLNKLRTKNQSDEN